MASVCKGGAVAGLWCIAIGVGGLEEGLGGALSGQQMWLWAGQCLGLLGGEGFRGPGILRGSGTLRVCMLLGIFKSCCSGDASGYGLIAAGVFMSVWRGQI